MGKVYKILTINPGSTSTKIAVFENENKVMETNLSHSNEELAKFKTVFEQFDFRKKAILDTLAKNNIDVNTLSAVTGRGGILKPIASGTYRVTNKMIEDLKTAKMEHASNLGAVIANEIGVQVGVPVFIVDPVVVDELQPIARYSGLPEMPRITIFHALNQKAIARKVAKELGKKYEELNLIIAHLGGGVSVGAHEKGKVIDVNNALDGEGPFSPERAGSLPNGALVEMCFSGQYTKAEVKKKMVGKGGFVAHLGTNDGREVEKRVLAGDTKAREVYEAMAYQVAKDIGACATVLKGKVDAICITGGLAYDKMFVGWIKERVSFIADVKIYPGENEMLALAEGSLRVLRGEEEAKEY